MLEAVKFTCAVAIICLLTVACEPETPQQSTGTAMDTQPASPEQAEPETKLIHPEDWPLQQTAIRRDADMEQRIADLLARMTLEEKVGQLMQADIAAVTPEQVRDFNLGSVLNGGNSAPGNDLRNTPDSWLALADEFVSRPSLETLHRHTDGRSSNGAAPLAES